MSSQTTIRKLRLERGLSRAEACRMAGCYSADYSKVEAGSARAWPRLRARIAVLLGVPEEELFDESGWPRGSEE